MKILCAALVAVCSAGAALTGGAFAQSNTLSFNQSPGADGNYHIDIGVTYDFPGTPPRNGNFGAGTVKITLPGATLSLDPSQPADPGYACFVGASGFSTTTGDTVTCSNDGQQSSTGLTFPTSVTVHLITPRCYAPADTTGAEADVWSAPNDPGTAPDAVLPITPTGDCTSEGGLQPVLPGNVAKCKVPKLAGVPLKSATGRLRNAHCSRGRVAYAHSKRVKSGRVISQALKAGTLLKNGAKVNLVVSKGP